MILRKPYAFLIKNFRLFHVVLTLLLAYSIYRTNLILSFFNEYLHATEVMVGANVASGLFNFYLFIVPFIVILFSIILLSVLYNKKKPYLFYILMIVVSLFALGVYNFAYSRVLIMQSNIVDVRTVSLVRDLLGFCLAAQTFAMVISCVRATGFDIRKFNFVKDLQDLQIESVDNEEFEIDVDVDTDMIHRGIRRRFRFIKYVYVENQFMIHMTTLLAIAIICFSIYFSLTVYRKVYRQGDTFATTNFIMRVDRAYITNQDYRGNILLDGEYFVIVDTRIKVNYVSQPFDTYSLDMMAGDEKFRPIVYYKDKMIDLGVNYIEQTITHDFENYIFVFRIPAYLVQSKMVLRYVNDIQLLANDLLPKYIRVALNPDVLGTQKETISYELGQSIDLTNTILNKGTVTLNSYDIASQFIVPYSFCVTDNECIPSIEYVKPSILNKYDKTLLKITGTMELANNTFRQLYDLYDFIDRFGVLKYELDGKMKTQRVLFREITTSRLKDPNTFYIEVLEEVSRADKIILQFKIRDDVFEYRLK